MDNERIKELEARIAEVRRRWPKHTPPRALMEELDELERELARERARVADEEGEDSP